MKKNVLIMIVLTATLLATSFSGIATAAGGATCPGFTAKK